jgi:uncharacterized membrane protein YdbT with pleckstrin-like domain
LPPTAPERTVALMSFPRRLLSEGEELVLDLRPHWIALVWPLTEIALAVVVAAFLLAVIPNSWPSPVRWAVAFLALAFIVVVAIPKIVAWATSHFVLTSHRVIHRSGWIAKHSMEIPLENIVDVRFNQGVFERMIGAGDLVLESAGEFGQETFSHVRQPERVQKAIYETAESNRRP